MSLIMDDQDIIDEYNEFLVRIRKIKVILDLVIQAPENSFPFGIRISKEMAKDIADFIDVAERRI